MVSCILRSYKLRVAAEALFKALSKEPGCFFLDSSLSWPGLGRYSFLGVRPFAVMSSNALEPFESLRKKLAAYHLHIPGCDIPFLGGAVGWLSYDLGFVLEDSIRTRPKDILAVPQCYFGFYNTAVIIDHEKKLLSICSAGFPETKGHFAKKLAERNFKQVYDLISRGLESATSDKDSACARRQPALFQGCFSKTRYLQAVKQAKEYIRRGDIYQVNLSQQFRAESFVPAEDLYCRLRKISPSCFSGYFEGAGVQVISSSPERFVKVDGGRIVTRPMKGTRPRGKNAAQDRRFKESLLRSPKDRAELVMIVDLERNDLGKVCDYGSIRVKTLRQLEIYSTVFQTTSTIEGSLHRSKDAIDVLRACFPGGSITGCPKIRAMEIIEELEPVSRYLYTGSLGYVSFTGAMDFNILIRTLIKIDNTLYLSVGGGIVADSDPQDEYRETLFKARGMFEALGCSVKVS
jgi:para-aminobenzoate synthetase component I